MSISFDIIYIIELLKVDKMHLRNLAYLKFPEETFEVCLFWENRPKILMTHPVGRFLSNQMFSRMSVSHPLIHGCDIMKAYWLIKKLVEPFTISHPKQSCYC